MDLMKVDPIKPGDKVYVDERPGDSPAMAMILIVARTHHEVGVGSTSKDHRKAIRHAVELAIEDKMRFDPEDFSKYGLLEFDSKGRFYNLATSKGNSSAWESIEKAQAPG